MKMETFDYWFAAALFAYLAYLGYSVFSARNRARAKEGPMKLGFAAGTLTFAATLFSTFTLLGMPDFFRNHGVGAWIFLGVTDVALGFVVLWFGLIVRRYKKVREFDNLSQVLNVSYGSGRFPQFVYLLGIFVFLIPYVSIQIGGISSFVAGIWPVPKWLAGLLMMSAIFFVVQLGGFRAIVSSDVAQWFVTLAVVWAVGWVCLNELGGFSTALEVVGRSNPDWLSTPGPRGLFSAQFLFASFAAIVLMPVSQPQLAWRVASFADESALRKGAVGIAVLSFLVILPTLFIGLYGALNYQDATAPGFWKGVLIENQAPLLAALAVIALLAAAMSTADSQLNSLRRELPLKSKTSALDEGANLSALLAFFTLAYLLSLIDSSELVLLARVSFAGTALLAPMILAAFASPNKRAHRFVPPVTLACLALFLLANFGLIEGKILGVRLDIVLIAGLSALTFALHKFGRAKTI